ncbi:hypothetical protein M9458_050599, partial [Cirrhinus mrigala]
ENPDSYGPGLLRAGPSGAEWSPPHSTVPSGDQPANPAGCSGLQRAHTSVSSARKRTGAGPPLRGSLEQLVRPSPARYPLQHTKLAAQITPEEQEVGTHLRKESIEVVPPYIRESGFYSRYFIVPKTVGTVLEFLQDRFSAGLAHSILKVYMVAISAYNAPLGCSSVGRNPLVTGFLHSALRLRPLARCSFAMW